MEKTFIIRRTMIVDGRLVKVEYAETPSDTNLEKAESLLAEECYDCTDSGKDVGESFGSVGKVRLKLLYLSLKLLDTVLKILLPGRKTSSSRHIVCLCSDHDINNDFINQSTKIVAVMEKENNAKQNVGNDNSEEYYNKIAAGICPKCGGLLDHVDGCSYCRDCGWSAC